MQLLSACSAETGSLGFYCRGVSLADEPHVSLCAATA